MRISNLALLFFLSSFALLAQPDVSGITQPAGATNPQIIIANASSTGTTTDTLTKLTGAPSTAVISGTSDTGGAVGITISGAGTTGNATIQIAGIAPCVFDGATTAGDYVQISSSTTGNCHDSGATYPTSGEVAGRVLSTNGGGGTYNLDLFPAEIKGGSGGGGAAGATFFSSTTQSGPSNSAVETTLIGASGLSGSQTIAANTFTSGQVLQVEGQGFYSMPVSPDSLTLKVKCGSTVLGQASFTPTAIVTNGTFRFWINFVAIGTGASGAFNGNGEVTLSGGTLTTPQVGAVLNTTNVSFDFTTSCAADVTATWGAAQAGESITGTNVAWWIPGAPVTSVNGQTGAVTVASAAGIYVTQGANNFGPVFPSTVPPTKASWTSGGTASTLNNITGGGLSFESPPAQSPGGWFEAAAGATFTFTVFLYGSEANSGVLGAFCADNAGNAALFHYSGAGGGFGLSVSHWTGMQNGGTPAFSASVAAPAFGPIPFIGWVRIQDNGTNRLYSYSVNGVDFVQFASEGDTAFVTCTRVGFEGYGDGTGVTPHPSLATIVSVKNSTP